MQIENHKEEVPFAHYEEKFRSLSPADVQERLSDVKWDGATFTVKLLGREFAIAHPDYAITACDNYGSYPFEEYAWKTIHFFYVYHGLPANKIYICDNDNHETKPVIDAITHFLPLGDHPLSCEIHASATLSDEVGEGTYITVTHLEDGLKSRADILKFWKERGEKCPGEKTQ